MPGIDGSQHGGIPAAAWKGIADRYRLSGQQLQVLRLIVITGDKEETIAKAMGVSPHTVHTHLKRLRAKLSANDREELVKRVFQGYLFGP